MTRLEVEFEWRPIGDVRLVDGNLVFPDIPATPGVYRLRFHTRGGTARVYVGETDNLRRRGGNYRHPGPRQRTSLRMNKELVAALAPASEYRRRS